MQPAVDPSPAAVPQQPLPQEPVAQVVEEETTGTKNLTSNELEEQEITKIADELRHNLDTKKSQTEGHLEAGDTIIIDKEGNITSSTVDIR
jgi:hypothetical protein